jgi:hypothetical protein
VLFRRLNEWGHRRTIRRARQRELVRLVQRSAPLPPPHEATAERLVALRGSLSADQPEIREIGERLNAEGGLALMIAVAERADTLCQLRTDEPILRDIEWAWHGIGHWQR